MKKIIVNGGIPLRGELVASGSKNAALPLIFASLLINGETTLRNVPDIGDVRVAIELLSGFGAEISFSQGILRINSKNVNYCVPNPRFCAKIRASTYLLGASLGRFGVAEIPTSGGCNFSSRPIDFHINAALKFGAHEGENHREKEQFQENPDKKILAAETPRVENPNRKILVAERLRGAKIRLPKPSVGASINALFMASRAEGESEIFGYAKEPHVLSVVDFLRAAGAKISLENEKIKLQPAPLHSVDFTVIGDMIEAGTYLTAALITGGKIKVTGFDPRELSAYLDCITKLGFVPEILQNGVQIDASHRKYTGNKISISAAPYPAFPTDLQPIIAPLIAKESGGEIRDLVFPERLGYLENLAPFGICSTVAEQCAKIEKSPLRSAKSAAPDLRGGMALLLAALAAKGGSEIASAELILRGYDRLEEKLISLGAEVKVLNM